MPRQYHAHVEGTDRDTRYSIAVIGRNHDKADDADSVHLQLWTTWLSASFSLTPAKARALGRHLIACADANELLPVAVPLAVQMAPALYSEPEAA